MEQLRDKTPQNHSNLRWQCIYHVQNGISVPASLALFKEAGAKREIIIDIVALPESEIADALITGEKSVPFEVYKDRWKLSGIVMSGNSTPQELTALFSKPYLTKVPQRR